MADDETRGSAGDWPYGDGEMARRIRAFDWSRTPLGPTADWPLLLRSTVELMLRHGFPMVLLWGPEALQIYNDGYRLILGERHPDGLGRPTFECWPETRDVAGPIVERARQGETVTLEDAHFPVGRSGALEDAWFTVTYSPVGDGSAPAPGVLITVVETTARVRGDRVRDAAYAALRESEGRFRQFAEASAGALWIRDAATLDLEYVSRAVASVYGVGVHDLEGDFRRWAALLVPEDRDGALARHEQARRGESVVHEFRIQRPSDRAFRWIRSTEFPLFDDAGRVQRVGGIAEDITHDKLATEHQTVLLAELQHRVRNIMAVIRSIVARTGENAASVQEYAELMAGRLLTFARVQAQHASQYGVTGPDVVLSPKAAEVVTLALHELATNAIKYGALATAAGHIDVSWTVDERKGVPWLVFDWRERGAPLRRPSASPTLQRRGFGSELIEGRVPYELGGHGKVEIAADGAHCHLEFPLRAGASLLETGAPQQGQVFGGALDMTGEATLQGHRILVAEDDYYLAADTGRALRGAGADILGPCPTEESALDKMGDKPTGAIVDINLGAGPSFRLAEALSRSGVPFVFITGYDESVVPAQFAATPRLQKPIDLKQIVNALAEALAGGLVRS